MQRSISILISALIVILIAGCTAQPKPKVIAEFKGSPVYLKEVIYSPEMRSVVENTIRDTKIRMLYERVIKSDLEDADIQLALRLEVQEAGSSEEFYEQLKIDNVDWDSKRRAIEVRLMEAKLREYFAVGGTQEGFQAYYDQNSAEIRAILARSRNIQYDQVDEGELSFVVNQNYQKALIDIGMASSLSSIEHVNLLEDPAVEIIDDDQPIVRLMHDGEENQMRDAIYNQGEEEYYGSTIITSADLYGREDFLGSLVSYFARKGLEGWIKEQTVADPALRLPEERLQAVLRERVLGNFPDSEDPVEDLEQAIAGRNLDYSEWKAWASLDARANWILDHQLQVTDEKIRSVYYSNEEQHRSSLATYLGISHTRVNIDDPQQFEIFKQAYMDGARKLRLAELKRGFLASDVVQVKVLVPTFEPTQFKAKTAEELAAEMVGHGGGHGEEHGEEHGSAESADHGDGHGGNEHAAAEPGHAEEHPEEPSHPAETH